MRLILAVLLLLSCFTTNAQNAGEEMKLQEEKLATSAEIESLEVIEILEQEVIVDDEDGAACAIATLQDGLAVWTTVQTAVEIRSPSAWIKFAVPEIRVAVDCPLILLEFKLDAFDE